MIQKILCFVFIILTSSISVARVFDLNKESLASYFLVSSGTSTIANKAYDLESAAVSYDNAGISSNLSGEFGFVYANKYVTWRFGFEVMSPAKLAGVSALNAGGATLYTLSSTMSGYYPKVGIEANLRTRADSRLFIFGYTGTMSLTVTNAYTGLTIAPNADFSYVYKGSCLATAGGLGYELASFDTTSMVIELGTRMMEVTGTTYGENATGFSTVTTGSTALKTDGSPRAFDFTGTFASLGFRFYLK